VHNRRGSRSLAPAGWGGAAALTLGDVPHSSEPAAPQVAYVAPAAAADRAGRVGRTTLGTRRARPGQPRPRWR
jgi:hypothetical protein